MHVYNIILKFQNSLMLLASHIEELDSAISKNGYYMVFDGNRLVTAYKRENLERYFNKNSVTLKQEIIKRWWQK